MKTLRTLLAFVCFASAGLIPARISAQTEDTSAPIAMPRTMSEPNASGWHLADVVVDWQWADEDGGSGLNIEACTQSSRSNREGTITLIAPCTDSAGNTAEVSITVNVDKSPPTSTIEASQPIGRDGMQFVFSGDDAVSGLAHFECTLTRVSVPTAAHTQRCGSPQTYGELAAGAYVFAVRAVDVAGRSQIDWTEQPFTIEAAPSESRLAALTALRGALAELVVPEDAKFDAVLGKALAKIDAAASIVFWQEDGNQLVDSGDDMFNRLSEAAKELSKIKNPPAAITNATGEITALSQLLAAEMLDAATERDATAKATLRSQREFDKALADVVKPAAVKAIKRFKLAWEYARLTVRRPAQEGMATAAAEAAFEALERESLLDTVFLPGIQGR